MDILNRWLSQGKWSRSRFSDLPELKQDDSAELQNWCAAAGGMALILSRASSAELSQRFAATHDLYQLLRRRLREGQRIDAGATLVGEALHEIAGVADPLTKASLQSCFRYCLKQRPARRNSQPPADSPETLMNSDLFFERSKVLREKIATARSTFAELR